MAEEAQQCERHLRFDHVGNPKVQGHNALAKYGFTAALN
jgi:hypothetical protein